jgi:hypothetical protein
MIKMYFRVEFDGCDLSRNNYSGFTNEDEALEYVKDICENYLWRKFVKFEVIKYYEWSKE